jgi:WS/DGAT/MGAT family acyltransferase
MSRQLGPQDAQFLYLQSGDVLTHVMSINVVAPVRARRRAGSFDDLVRHLSERCRLAPVYHQRLHRVPGDLDLPYWVEDPGLDPARHIERTRVPRPGNWGQFCRLAARRFEAPMALDRPLWDLLVVEGLDAIPWAERGSRALLARYHHAAIDGASGAHALAALFDRDRRGTPAVRPGGASGEVAVAPGVAAAVTRAVRAGVTAPVRVVDALLRKSPGLLAGAARSLADRGDRPGQPPVTRFNHRIGGRRSFAATRVTLADLRAIRTLVPGATVNDVILAICGGALRSYLSSKGELPDSSLIALAPINARPRKGDADPTGNDITAMPVPLATDVADPVARLAAIHAHTRAAKEGRTGLGVRLLADVGRELPGVALPVLARLVGREDFARSQANLVISNVPGSAVPLYLEGARVTHQFGMGPLAHGLGLFISANSYAGETAFCVTADPSQVPDPAGLCRRIDASFRSLRGAVSPPGAGSPASLPARAPTRRRAPAPPRTPRPTGRRRR